VSANHARPVDIPVRGSFVAFSAHEAGPNRASNAERVKTSPEHWCWRVTTPGLSCIVVAVDAAEAEAKTRTILGHFARVHAAAGPIVAIPMHLTHETHYRRAA